MWLCPYRSILYGTCIYIINFQFFPNLVKFYGNPSDESTFKDVLGFFEYLEASLTIQSDQTAYLYGPGVKPGAPDYLIWPMLERLCLLKAISPGKSWV